VIGQHLRTERSREDAAQIYDTKATKRSALTESKAATLRRSGLALFFHEAFLLRHLHWIPITLTPT
jgi:hypothetical protein